MDLNLCVYQSKSRCCMHNYRKASHVVSIVDAATPGFPPLAFLRTATRAILTLTPIMDDWEDDLLALAEAPAPPKKKKDKKKKRKRECVCWRQLCAIR